MFDLITCRGQNDSEYKRQSTPRAYSYACGSADSPVVWYDFAKTDIKTRKSEHVTHFVRRYFHGHYPVPYRTSLCAFWLYPGYRSVGRIYAPVSPKYVRVLLWQRHVARFTQTALLRPRDIPPQRTTLVLKLHTSRVPQAFPRGGFSNFRTSAHSRSAFYLDVMLQVSLRSRSTVGINYIL